MALILNKDKRGEQTDKTKNRSRMWYFGRGFEGVDLKYCELTVTTIT